MKKNELVNFHLSLPCRDIVETRKFYEKELEFKIGRRQGYIWFDVNIYGNQVTFTYDDAFNLTVKNYNFEDSPLPTFHFGVIIEEVIWKELYAKYKDKDYFAIGSIYFLKDKKGQHQSFFLRDPNGYFIEFKTFFNQTEVFEFNLE
jgi:extradiol dioxygenase family protein